MTTIENSEIIDWNIFEDLILEIVSGLQFIANEAKKNDLSVPSHIICGARDDVIHWARNMPANAKNANQLAERMASRDGLCMAIDFIAKYSAIEDATLRNEIIQAIDQTRDKIKAKPSKKKER